MNQNDGKILDLKKKIESKKNELKKAEKFNPVTHCSIELDGVRYNINVLNADELIILMCRVNMYKMSLINLKLENEIKICGFTLDEWIKDLMAKYKYISRKVEETNLKQMERKLDDMLSNEKKVELELNSIEDMLKN